MTEQPEAASSVLVTLASPRSPHAEAYRTLRTNIQFSSFERSVRALLITSPGIGEGKSTTAANLAVVNAEAGLKVILVDADLRRPSLHTLFGLAQTPGFSTALLAGASEAIPLQETAVPGLRLLASGVLPPNPSALISSQRCLDLLEALRAQADLVLIDSPPVLAVSDASMLATRCDGVVLVISSGQTTRDAARRAKLQLDKVGATLIGPVLNRVPLDRSLASYYEAE